MMIRFPTRMNPAIVVRPPLFSQNENAARRIPAKSGKPVWMIFPSIISARMAITAAAIMESEMICVVVAWLLNRPPSAGGMNHFFKELNQVEFCMRLEFAPGQIVL